MDADKPSVVVEKFVVGGWIMLRLRGGWLFVAEKNA